jgi:hypothetical protein
MPAASGDILSMMSFRRKLFGGLINKLSTRMPKRTMVLFGILVENSD